MKILLFTLEYPPFKGGVANYYYNLVENADPDDSVFVLADSTYYRTLDRGVERGYDKIIYKPLISKFLPFLRWLPAIWYLYREIKSKKIEHVIVGQILPLGTATMIVLRLLYKGFLGFGRSLWVGKRNEKGIKYSVVIHGMDMEYAMKKSRKKRLALTVLKKADKIICNSSYGKGLVVKYAPSQLEKTFVVNPGISSKIQETRYKKQTIKEKFNLQDKIVLFSIGRLVKRKGFDRVIEVMPEVLKVVPNLVYVIAGVGPDEGYLKSLVSKNNHPQPFLEKEGGISFLGKISDEEKWDWLAACDIFIMPAREIDGDVEGFGIVYLEANLAGKPVIAGDSGGVKDAVLNEETGLLIDPNNREAIKDAIIKLAKDKELRLKLGSVGKERAIDKYSWEKQARKFFNIIKN